MSRARILVVDDEPMVGKTLQSILDCFGFETNFATSCEEAKELAESFAPEAILVDWMLKEQQDGVTLANWFRQTMPDVRIVIISGYDVHSLRDSLPVDANFHVLQKPCSMTELAKALDIEMQPA